MVFCGSKNENWIERKSKRKLKLSIRSIEIMPCVFPYLHSILYAYFFKGRVTALYEMWNAWLFKASYETLLHLILASLSSCITCCCCYCGREERKPEKSVSSVSKENWFPRFKFLFWSLDKARWMVKKEERSLIITIPKELTWQRCCGWLWWRCYANIKYISRHTYFFGGFRESCPFLSILNYIIADTSFPFALFFFLLFRDFSF